jgi:transcriptional regulator with XRE-family HTH domain
MTLGQVIAKERTACGIAPEEMAARLGLGEAEYQEIEAGRSAAETWGPRLATIAVTLEAPTARLLTPSGCAADARDGDAGRLIAHRRTERNLTVAAMASALGMSVEEYESIERGESPLESIGPTLLRVAEIIEQPVFNLFYPCGLPFETLDDYP